MFRLGGARRSPLFATVLVVDVAESLQDRVEANPPLIGYDQRILVCSAGIMMGFSEADNSEVKH